MPATLRRALLLGLASSLLAVLPAGNAVSATVAAGEAQSCAIFSGALKCWGADSIGGHLGTGVDLPQNDSADPLPVAGLGSGVTDVELTFSGGGTNTTGCAVKDGGVHCWGSNDVGQYGNGTKASGFGPAPTSGLGSGVSKISVATSRACAVQSGAAKCWGQASLGDGSGEDRLTPTVPVAANGGDHKWPPSPTFAMTSAVTDIAAGWRHVCAIWSGAVRCSGGNNTGQLGYGAPPMTYDTRYTYHMRPMQSDVFPAAPVQIAAGTDNTCARLANGSVWCWGSNSDGALGRGSFTLPEHAHITPAQVVGLDSGVTDLSMNARHACVIKDGLAYCWGDGQVGKLGNDSQDPQAGDSAAPVQVAGLTGVTSIAAGLGHTCAEAGGRKYCWGYNGHYQLGTDAVRSWSGVPVEVTGAVPKPPTPPTAPTPPRAPAAVKPPATQPKPKKAQPLADTIAARTSSRLSRTRYATLATVACPPSATCRTSAPSTVSATIRRKTFSLRVSGLGAIRGGRRATVKVRLSRAAAQRLGGRTVTVKLRLRTTVNGASSARTLSVKVTGRT